MLNEAYLQRRKQLKQAVHATLMSFNYIVVVAITLILLSLSLLLLLLLFSMQFASERANFD